MLGSFSSPRSWRKRSKEKQNPYSNRGLDKFSALLSELDEKRQSIYAKKIDSDGPPLVRFVFTSSGECVPIMIKTEKTGKKKVVSDGFKVNTESKTDEVKEIKTPETETERKQSCVLNQNLKKMSRPNHIFLVTMIFVLIFLVFFGRTISIMCTCIVLYLVPIIRGQSRDRGSTKKKTIIQKNESFRQRMARDQTVHMKKFPRLAAPVGTR